MARISPNLKQIPVEILEIWQKSGDCVREIVQENLVGEVGGDAKSSQNRDNSVNKCCPGEKWKYSWSRGRNTVEECCATGGTVEVSQGECKSGRRAGQVLGKLLQNGEYWPSGDHEMGNPLYVVLWMVITRRAQEMI